MALGTAGEETESCVNSPVTLRPGLLAYWLSQLKVLAIKLSQPAD